MPMRLENWAVVAMPSSPTQAPELWRQRLHGKVYNNPKFEDGTIITTSCIESKRNGKVVTQSNSEYLLGEVSIQYESIYPDAYARLMNSLDEV